MNKIFHLIAKIIVNDSDIGRALRSMNQSIITRIKNFTSENWIVKAIVEHDTKIFECYCRQK